MSFTQRLVDTLAGIGNRSADRRGFLASSALVATAITVDPLGFITKPVSAYDAVCGAAAGCNDGWSAFCCTINNGKNSCPPGSFVAGWWKADNSGFCCGSARYYIDCNAFAGDRTHRCHCPSGTCDQRRVACNQFRYGQCHQEIGPYGPVVCRMVTCTPPWQFDASCTTSSATDNNTRSHTAPCLPGQCPSEIEKYYFAIGGRSSGLGETVGPERVDAAGGRYQMFNNGAIVWSKATGPHALRSPITAKYSETGGSTGVLGYPIMDSRATGDGVGVFAKFQRGMILSSPRTGTRALHGAVLSRYHQLGGLNSALGYPLMDVTRSRSGGNYARFQGGLLAWIGGTAVPLVRGPVLHRYLQLGGTEGGVNLPLTDSGKTADGIGEHCRFRGGHIIWHPSIGARLVRGAFLHTYLRRSYVTGPLGYPVTDQYPVTGGAEQKFQRGTLFHHFATNTVRVR